MASALVFEAFSKKAESRLERETSMGRIPASESALPEQTSGMKLFNS